MSNPASVGPRHGVCVVGASGRMGSRTVRLLGDHPSLVLASSFDRDEKDPSAAIAKARVVVDFSAPAACRTVAPLCARAGVAYLCASTALTADDERALSEAARVIPVLQAANLSVGVNVLLGLARDAAARLGPAFEVEIFEAHHRAKKDAPSGTALALGRAVRDARPELHDVVGHEPGARAATRLGYAAVRGGDVAGEHTVFFLGDGERVELTHRASTPDIFARGALLAAAWLVGRDAGRYAMADVLG